MKYEGWPNEGWTNSLELMQKTEWWMKKPYDNLRWIRFRTGYQMSTGWSYDTFNNVVPMGDEEMFH